MRYNNYQLIILKLFYLLSLDLRRLYPFDSLRSLRVTVVGKALSVNFKKEDDHIIELFQKKTQ